MNWLKTQLQKELWSPYVAGILLGIVGVLAVWLSDSLLGASGRVRKSGRDDRQSSRAQSLLISCISTSSCRPDHLGRDPAGRDLLWRDAGRHFQQNLESARRNGDEQWKQDLWAADLEALGDRFSRRHHAGIRRGHCRRLHQRAGDFRRDAACPGSLSVHCRDVRLRHPHRLVIYRKNY